MSELIVNDESKKTQVIEINGIKMEVDMRYAKRVDNFKIGDRVKVLIPTGYSDDKHKVLPGVIVGFEAFDKLPTIIVACMEIQYSSAELKIFHFNAETEKKEIIKASDDFMPIKKAAVLELFTYELEKKKAELEALERKRDYFLQHFNQYFTDINP